MLYVVCPVPTSIVFAFLIASLLNKSVKGKGLFRTLFYLPSIIPIVAMGAIWMWIFNPDVGLANTLLKAVGLPPNKWLSSESTVIPTLVFVNLWTTGSTMVIFLAGMQDVPRQLIEAVEIDGGGVTAKLFHVIVPIMTPTIFYNVVMGFINDAGRSQQCQPLLRILFIPGILPVYAHGQFLCDRLDSVRDHYDTDRNSVQVSEPMGLLRR